MMRTLLNCYREHAVIKLVATCNHKKIKVMNNNNTGPDKVKFMR